MSLRHIEAVTTAYPNPHGEHISIIKALPGAQTEKAILTPSLGKSSAILKDLDQVLAHCSDDACLIIRRREMVKEAYCRVVLMISTAEPGRHGPADHSH